MDFEEFLLAMGDEFTYPILKDHFDSLKPLGDMHSKMMYASREYMLVGGMSQAVLAYKKAKDFSEADFVKQSILSLYESDMADQEEENPEHIKNISWHIPSELSKHDKRCNLSHADPNARLREYKGPFNWLDEAMIVNIAESVAEPTAAFNLSTINPSFKCYMMDTGLLISLACKNKHYLENGLYEAILFDKLHVNEGMIAENAIAQALRAKDQRIYYFKKSDKEGKRITMEVDFLIRRGNKIIPIEAKSSSSASIKSLTLFKEAYRKATGTQYVFHEGDIKQANGIIYLPYCMASLS